MSVPDAAPPPNWSDRLKNSLRARRHQHGDIMWVVRKGCQEIMELHKGRQTESFYEKMLACYLYERGIPYMTQAMFWLCGVVLKLHGTSFETYVPQRQA